MNVSSVTGVAILSSPPEHNNSNALNQNTTAAPRHPPRQQHANAPPARLQKILKDLEEQDPPAVVKLGDASIAAPFTSKLSTILCGEFLTLFITNLNLTSKLTKP